MKDDHGEPHVPRLGLSVYFKDGGYGYGYGGYGYGNRYGTGPSSPNYP
jgi:hypothetical protein